MAVVASMMFELAECSVSKGDVAGRVKRGHHGYGHGGGGGHGPGSGGGAAGPVYFCGWVGKTEGYRKLIF